MPTELVDVEDFLGHSGSSRGGGQILDWKEKGHANVWLHRHCPFSVAVWRHSFLRYDTVEDEQTREPTRVLKYATLLCPESEEVLKMQGRHSKATGELLVPYEVCPMHKMLEWLYQMVRSQQMHWLQEVFRFEAGEKIRVFHATGLFNGFKGTSVGPAGWKEAAKVGLYPKGENGAFKENWMASLNYIFRVVDNDFVKEGVQVAIVPQSVGDHTKIRVREMMQDPPEGLGKEYGNPLRNPYCIRWKHHPEQTEPNKMYSAQVIDPSRMPPSEEVLRLIDETEPPSIDHLIAPPAWASVRASLERAALIDMPWDDWFPQETAEEVEGDDKKLRQRPNGAPPAPRGPAPEVGRRPTPPPAPAAPRTAPQGPRGLAPRPPASALPRAPQAPPPAPAPAPRASEVQRVRCDNESCDNVLLITEAFCAKCGMRYDQAEEPPPPPAPLPRRSAAIAQGATGNPGFRPPQPAAQRPASPPAAGPSSPFPRGPRAAGSQARQPAAPAQRPPAFDEFPFGANAPETGEELAPQDDLPWGRG